jgi:predicted metallopeptidase
VEWELAPDIQKRLARLVARGSFGHVSPRLITAVRGRRSSSRALARIWSLPRVWQMVLGVPPQYVIEVLEEKFAKLSPEEQEKTLLHELLHIPKTFSGALLPHRRGKFRLNRQVVEKIYAHIRSYDP